MIITHNGEFHADEVFGVAILNVLYPSMPILRTRDAKRFADAKYLLDQGSEFNATKGLFDHHQTGGAGERVNGVPYATAGLIWKEFGYQYLNTISGLDGLGMHRLCHEVDLKMIQGVDALDVGAVDRTCVLRDGAYAGANVIVRSFSEAISMQNGNPDFDDMSDKAQHDRFMAAVTFVQKSLLQLVKGLATVPLWTNRVEHADKGESVLVLDFPCPDVNSPWSEEVLRRQHIHYVVFQASDGANWRIKAAPVEAGKFDVRKPLPEAWAGKRGADLDAVAGISGGIFIHPGRWIGGATKREAILELARQAAAS